jgi:hypothetical protein
MAFFVHLFFSDISDILRAQAARLKLDLRLADVRYRVPKGKQIR